MASNRLGIHWLRHHPNDSVDFDFIRRLHPASVKTFEWMHNDANFVNQLLASVGADCILLGRNHPRSEQKDDLWRDPIGTGKRHAQEWRRDIDNGQCYLPPERTYFLGVNEPDATHGDRHAIDLYTVAFLDELRILGLKGGAFNFSTGHPRTVDGTGNTAPDYAFFEASRQAIVRGGHIAVQHIYGSAQQANVPGHYDRLRACPWQDVTWVIGECGIDAHVATGGAHDGYLLTLQPPTGYPQWMEQAIRGTNDPRIHSWQIFTYDFSHPWSSFDAREVNESFLAWNWQGIEGGYTPTPEPTPPDDAALVHPLPAGSYTITQHFWERPEAYADFGMPGHNGTDFGAAGGTPVRCMSDGVVAYTGIDPSYGNYVRVYHDSYKAHTFYAHLSRIDVQPGDNLAAGVVLGAVGSTGNSTGSHLHLEIRLGDAANYVTIAPMPKGRCDPETWAALFGLSLATGYSGSSAGQVYMPLVMG